MIILSLLLAAAAPAPVMIQRPAHHIVHRRVVRHVVRRRRHVDARLNLAGCGYSATGLCAGVRSSYRLPLDQSLAPSGKSEALAQTGGRCGVIGQKVCPGHTRTVLRAGQ